MVITFNEFTIATLKKIFLKLFNNAFCAYVCERTKNIKVRHNIQFWRHWARVALFETVLIYFFFFILHLLISLFALLIKKVVFNEISYITYNYFHNILRFFDFLSSFLSPQVDRCAIITYKHGKYELPHEFQTS